MPVVHMIENENEKYSSTVNIERRTAFIDENDVCKKYISNFHL